MTEFTASGKVRQGGNLQSFERTVEAESESHARELLYSQLCSEHSIKRSRIEIEEISG